MTYLLNVTVNQPISSSRYWNSTNVQNFSFQFSVDVCDPLILYDTSFEEQAFSNQTLWQYDINSGELVIVNHFGQFVRKTSPDCGSTYIPKMSIDFNE